VHVVTKAIAPAEHRLGQFVGLWVHVAKMFQVFIVLLQLNNNRRQNLPNSFVILGEGTCCFFFSSKRVFASILKCGFFKVFRDSNLNTLKWR